MGFLFPTLSSARGDEINREERRVGVRIKKGLKSERRREPKKKGEDQRVWGDEKQESGRAEKKEEVKASKRQKRKDRPLKQETFSAGRDL